MLGSVRGVALPNAASELRVDWGRPSRAALPDAVSVLGSDRGLLSPGEARHAPASFEEAFAVTATREDVPTAWMCFIVQMPAPLQSPPGHAQVALESLRQERAAYDNWLATGEP